MFLVIFKEKLCIICESGKVFSYKNKTLKKYWKNIKKKYREFCQFGKVGTMIWLPNGVTVKWDF